MLIGGMVALGRHRLADGALRLPAAPQRAAAGPADHRDRRLGLPAGGRAVLRHASRASPTPDRRSRSRRSTSSPGPRSSSVGITIQRAALFTIARAGHLRGVPVRLRQPHATGRAMQATSQDPDTARLMGIDIDRIIMVAFALGAASPRWPAWPRACGTPTSTSGWASSPASRPSPRPCSAASATSTAPGRRPRPRRGRGHGHLHSRHVRRLGLEGRLGVRAADPGPGLPAAGPARREGGGPRMSNVHSADHSASGNNGRPSAGAGSGSPAARPDRRAIPALGRTSVAALDGMTVVGYPSPLQSSAAWCSACSSPDSLSAHG